MAVLGKFAVTAANSEPLKHVDVGITAKRVASWEELYRVIQVLGGDQ